MARRTINVTLSPEGIRKAIEELNRYKADLQRKMEIIRDKLAGIGVDVIRQTMDEVAADDEPGEWYAEAIYDDKENMAGAAIRLSGNKVLFIEFSAGITYGEAQGQYPIQNDETGKFGFGTYNPDSPNATSGLGWWYVDENGEKHHTYGNRAYHPMYNAEVAIIMAAKKAALEVFGNG